MRITLLTPLSFGYAITQIRSTLKKKKKTYFWEKHGGQFSNIIFILKLHAAEILDH